MAPSLVHGFQIKTPCAIVLFDFNWSLPTSGRSALDKIADHKHSDSSVSDSTIQEAATRDTITLARLAASGEPAARKQVNDIADPIIRYQTDRFCKRFCYDNKYHYRCSLEKPWGKSPAGAHLCEWGNASYGWMLDDLTGSGRLQKFEGKNNARLNDYLFAIANSLPFYERWKDWRFGKLLHVPTYVQALHANAAAVFRGLHQQLNPNEIAQKHQLELALVKQLADQIIILLTQRKRLHLLNPPRTISLTGFNIYHGTERDDVQHQGDIPWHDTAPEDWDASLKLQDAWQSLSIAEQFVLESMMIEEQDANDVLQALQTLDIAIAEGIPASQTNRQQLYYFRRKTLEKLARSMGVDEAGQ
jgi:hypothetical protein